MLHYSMLRYPTLHSPTLHYSTFHYKAHDCKFDKSPSAIYTEYLQKKSHKSHNTLSWTSVVRKYISSRVDMKKAEISVRPLLCFH